ncbi:hypothetical protein C1646_739225 [Rhizophagus diaphanus]|nr:hypothetical protein C1646_739225 [Rhizophagus diaphanus] [Rhizophagus sp. MUCL 43196]
MACSKVMLGDFPELTYDIMQYFRNDIPTLHSCILVNRFWCQIVIPLLWKDPFSMKNPKNFHFIEIYLQKISEKDKTQLNRFSKYESFGHNHMTIENQLSKIINSQKNLKKIVIAHSKYIYGAYIFDTSIPLYNIIGGTNNTNPLKIIIFHKIDFRNILRLKEAFEQLSVLESIHILDCLIFNTNFIQQIIDLNKPFKLRSLFIRNEYVFRSEDEDKNLQIESLFQKFGDYLENIGFESIVNCELKYRVLEIISNYCKNIRFFDIYTTSIQKAHIVLDSVKIFEQNLNYLSISAFILYGKDDESMIELFLRLANVLPCKLEYLNLSCSTEITKSIWEVFLKNLKNIFIKKFLLKISILVNDILPYVKEYIIKENIAEYLAIRGYIEILVSENNVHQCRKDLFNMTDELKEFELYNIKVKEYNDLYIKAHEFIDEMY